MIPQIIGNQLRAGNKKIQSRWKSVILIMFLSVNSLMLLIYSSPWKHNVVDSDKSAMPPSGKIMNYATPTQDTVQFPEANENLDSIHYNYDKDDSDETFEMENSKNSIQISLPRKGLLDYGFNYIHNPVHLCSEQDISIVIGVCSAVNKFDLREAIRKTWGGGIEKRHLAVKVVFVLGALTEKYMHLQNIVDEESQRYEDIIQADLLDHYSNLTLKTLSYFHWVGKYCPQTRFVMKTDDDVFLNLSNLLGELSKVAAEQRTKFMMGHVIQGARPIKDRHEKWFMPEGLFKGQTYPDYLSGSAYVFPKNLISLLLQQTKQTSFFWLEDIYVTGMLTQDLQIPLIPSDKFIIQKIQMEPCDFRVLIAAHGFSHFDMYKVWRSIHRPDLDCSNVKSHFDSLKVL